MRADVIVIGTGQAAVPLATRLAAAGRKVVVAERAEPGGTCVNYGCTPTKTMIASARAAHVARTARRLGVDTGEVRVDFAKVVARKDEVVARWQKGVLGRLEGAGERLTLVRGHARFVGPHEIDVAGERHQAETIVINVGARPGRPRLPGLDGLPWLDNAKVMALASLPEHLLVLGGGYIGCELGQMFRRFGARVTLVDHNPRLLSREDPDVSTALEEVFRGEGIDLALGTTVERAEGGPGRVTLHLAGGRALAGSHLLIAAGRVPNTDDLGCDAAGIERDPHGAIVVDDHYQTRVAGVFAVGDAIGQPQFTHTSWDDHRLLYDHLTSGSSRSRADRVIPYTVFTDPQVAGVGLREAEAKARGIAHEAATMPFGSVARAIELDETAGLLKVLVDAASERILGATIVGAEAGELIHIVVALMQAGAPARALVDAQVVHPTFAEGVQSVLMRLARYQLR